MNDWVKDKIQAGLYKRKRDTTDVWAIKARIKGGGPVSYTIGKVDLFKPQEARLEAKRVLAMLAKGIHPDDERKKKVLRDNARNLTLEKAIEQYTQIVSWKKKTRIDALSTFKRRFGDWYQRPLASITKEDVQVRFLKIKSDVLHLKKKRDRKRISKDIPIKTYRNEIGLGESSRAFRYLNAIFNSFANDDAGDEKLLPRGNPCSILKDKKLRKTLKPRERYLDDEQRSSLYDLLGSVKHKDYPGNVTENDADLVWLIIHTGLRLDEARTITWSAVNFERETFTAFNTKNHTNHTLPMTAATRDMFKRRHKSKIKSKFVFPSPNQKNFPMTASRTFTRISKDVGFEFTAHDLRRTVATVASDLGYDINTIGMVLNHAKGSVTSKYIQSTHKRLKDILINIQDHLFGQSYD